MKTLRQLILEEKCPLCGDPKAYVGLNDVECPNRKCKAYSTRQEQDVVPQFVKAEVYNEGDVNYSWTLTRKDGSTEKYYSYDGEWPRAENDDSKVEDNDLFELLTTLSHEAAEQGSPPENGARAVIFSMNGRQVGQLLEQWTEHPGLDADGLANVVDPTLFDVKALAAAIEKESIADGFLLCVAPGKFVDLSSGAPDDRPDYFDSMPGASEVPADQVPVGVAGWWVNGSALDNEGIAHALENGRSFKI